METESTSEPAAREDAQTLDNAANSLTSEVARKDSPEAPDSQCQHLLELWVDGPTKEYVTRKYKSVVIWAFDRYREHGPAKKKRKAS